MKRLVQLLLLVGLCAGTAFAAEPAAIDEAALRAQADAWDAAIVRKDRAAIAANMSEGFMQIGSDGRVADKAAFLEGITSDKLVIAPYTVTVWASGRRMSIPCTSCPSATMMRCASAPRGEPG